MIIPDQAVQSTSFVKPKITIYSAIDIKLYSESNRLFSSLLNNSLLSQYLRQN